MKKQFSLYSILLIKTYKKNSKSKEELNNNRLCLFSYGSGAASSMFSILVKDSDETNQRFTLDNILNVLNERKSRLSNNRVEIEPDLYDLYLQQREIDNKKVPREAQFSPKTLYPGTWYLKSVDDKYRRVYDRVESNFEFNYEQARQTLYNQLSNLSKN